MSDDHSDAPAPLSVGYDSYRGVRDPRLMIFVEHDAVPPFRFKAGGWELLHSSIELNSVMKARVAERGYFMFRVNQDRSGGVELSDPETPFAEAKRDDDADEPERRDEG